MDQLLCGASEADWWIARSSVRGPRLAREGGHCEDATSAWVGLCGAAVAVCDGVGSAPQGGRGARAAAAAARDAGRWFIETEGARIEEVPDRILAGFRLRTADASPGDVATTCLLALDTAKKGSFSVALGDGMIARIGTDSTRYVLPERSVFGSETLAVGVHGGTDWSICQFPALTPGETWMLATDGVADDLLLEKRDAFCQFCLEELKNCRPNQRSKWIKDLLGLWPVPSNSDDKSLALLHRTAGPGRMA